jgi:2-amino-4-hydroxy-6-hydroxymethyldihydropteridine diphosphokinase
MKSMIGTLGLGSNLGRRRERLAQGLARLQRAGLELLAVSSVWETAPIDASGGWFLNMAASFRTERGPHAVLDLLLEVERLEGRVRDRRNGPRTLDLDLLTLGELQRNSERLTLPHPRMWERLFVLEPLAEVAPQLRNPRTGRTVVEETRRLRGRDEVIRIGRLAPAGSHPV